MISIFLFCFSIFFALGLIALGFPLIKWAFIEFTGFRPTVGQFTVPLILVVGFSALLAVIFFVAVYRFLLLRTRLVANEPKAVPRYFIFVLAAMALGFIAFLFFVINPTIQKLAHVDRWPEGIDLVNFDVCATEVKLSNFSRREFAKGLIKFEIVNRSGAMLKEMTFTVEAPPRVYHRFEVRGLPPGGFKVFGSKVKFGNILYEPPAEMSGRPMRYYARLYGDRWRFDSGYLPALVRKPQNSQISIGDCLAVDVTGAWVGQNDFHMFLAQNSDIVVGSMTGGDFSTFPNLLLGYIKDKTVTGTFEHRRARILSAGTFKLVLMDDGRISGEWKSGDGFSGQWLLEYAGPPPVSFQKK